MQAYNWPKREFGNIHLLAKADSPVHVGNMDFKPPGDGVHDDGLIIL